MSHIVSKQIVLTCALLITLTSCTKSIKALEENSSGRTFATPTEAGAALLAAAKSGDRAAWLEIFGPDGDQVLFTGDAAQDKASRQDFVDAYTRMNRWRKINAGGQTLYIGAENYAFPIPLGQNRSGEWYFDTAAGRDEILARRIGRNELTAIAACEAMANAERQYFGQTHDGKSGQYSQRFVSDPGKQNGLYWSVSEGQPASPLGQLGDFAKVVASSPGDQPPLFNGYRYRILAKPGSFAILAYPDEYRNSGIMTFIVGKDGAVYQRDLGEKSGDVALAITEFNPADGWSQAVPHTGSATRTQQ